MNENSETFIIYVFTLKALKQAMSIYYFWIFLLTILQKDKTPTEIPTECANFADDFSTNLDIELFKNTGINKHVIKLVRGKQPSFGLIYNLSPVELEMLKTYIKTYLKTGFI